MKKENIIKLIIVVVIASIIAGVLVFIKHNTDIGIKPSTRDKSFIELKEVEEIEDKFTNNKLYEIYNNYNDLTKDFRNTKIRETDFNNNNYLVIKIDYNPCSDENITPVGYKIDGNNIKINIEYKAVCGLCAPDYLYYAIKIDKDITNPKVKIDYKKTNDPKCDPNVSYKPMIYLYPTEKTDVKVVLKNKKLLTTTYPKYKDSWEVIADTDGTLIDKESGREYYGLYWEGKNYTKINMKKGFVVKGSDTTKFLEEKLNELGLTDKEAEEFIVYWLPKMEENKYNYIYFATTDEVNKYMPLEITPEPDSLIRILMYYKPLNKKIDVKEQKIKTVYRKDFTVVEWGGTILK